MLYYSYYHNIDKALRKITFYWLKWYPEHKSLLPFSLYSDPFHTKHLNYILMNGISENMRLERLINHYGKRNWNVKGSVDLTWIEHKRNKS
jgi:hypothetical protein